MKVLFVVGSLLFGKDTNNKEPITNNKGVDGMTFPPLLMR
jgi:hypothetical protein